MALRITARPWCNSLAISRIDLRFRKYSRRMISFWSTVIISSTPLAKMSLSHLVTKRAATVVPFSMAKTPSTGPVFYDHTHSALVQDLREAGWTVGKAERKDLVVAMLPKGDPHCSGAERIPDHLAMCWAA